MDREFDYIILGAGIYGLYASRLLIERGYKVVLLEYDNDAFTRASYVNQARLHRGYHYPRSITTALKTASYFSRFSNDFDFAINNSLKKIYGISKTYSLTSGKQFQRFCENAKIPCRQAKVEDYYNSSVVEMAFETEEYVFDAIKIKKWLLEKLKASGNFSIYFNVRLGDVSIKGDRYLIDTNFGDRFISPVVLNATYASVNQVIEKFGFEKFDIKYEVSEIILCQISKNIEHVGLTLMDGPFFSVMPFGQGGIHSLTSVTFTHHKTSHENLPKFPCQSDSTRCSYLELDNCNICNNRPNTSWSNMYQLSKKYLQSNIDLIYERSLFSIKPILARAKLDDGRPTVIVGHGNGPRLISVLSGKISTIYDLDEVLI